MEWYIVLTHYRSLQRVDKIRLDEEVVLGTVGFLGKSLIKWTPPYTVRLGQC